MSKDASLSSLDSGLSSKKEKEDEKARLSTPIKVKKNDSLLDDDSQQVIKEAAIESTVSKDTRGGKSQSADMDKNDDDLVQILNNEIKEKEPKEKEEVQEATF